MQTIIDCHAHIYPDKIAEKASKNIGAFYDMPMRYDGRVEVLTRLCAENGIGKCLINSVATTPEQVTSINNFISGTVKNSNGFFDGLCTLHHHMSEGEIADELDRAEGLGLRGIKLHPDFQQFSIDDKCAYKIYEAAEGRLPVLFHTGDRRFSYSNPERLAKIIRDFPNLVAVGAHFGGWSEWADAVRFLADEANVYVDTSSSFYAMTPAEAEETIRIFGAERVMFGTDYPMWDMAGELQFFNSLSLTERERALILSENVIKVFNTN